MIGFVQNGAFKGNYVQSRNLPRWLLSLRSVAFKADMRGSGATWSPKGPGCVKTCTDEKNNRNFILLEPAWNFTGRLPGSHQAA